MQNAIEVLLL